MTHIPLSQPPDDRYFAGEQRANGAAIASLVLGLLGCIPFLAGVAAIILGLIGIRRSRESGATGKGMAIAGIVLGITSIVGWGGLASVLGFAYGESKPAGSVARQFLQDVSAGNITAAMANSSGFTPAQLQAESAKMRAFGALQSVSITSFNLSTVNGRTAMHLAGLASFPGASKTCNFELVKRAGTYKVTYWMVQ